MESPTTNLWWDETALLPGESKAQALVNVCKSISSNPIVVRERQTDLRMLRLFENDATISSLYQFGGAAPSVRQADDGYGAQPWNELRAVVEAAAAQIASKKPRTRFMTDGADFETREKAKTLSTFCDAIRAETSLYEIAQDVFVDACVFKYGVIQRYNDRDRVRFQRVLPGEVLVDPAEGMFGTPRRIQRRRPADKDGLISQFAKGNAKLALAIEQSRPIEGSRGGTASRMVWAYEGWAMPSHEGADDGRHVVAVDGVSEALVDEKHTLPRFPLLFFRWSKQRVGFSGKSICEVGSYTQLEIRRLLEKISRGERLICVPHIALKRNSKIVKNVNNEIGSYIEFSDVPPQFLSPEAFSPEVYQQLERHCNKVWELAGVSKNFGQGTKPAGLTSGKAQRDAVDIASQRFTLVQQRWEEFNVDLDRAGIDGAVEIYGKNKKYEVTANNTKLLQRIDWKDIKLDENQYQMMPMPMSFLPSTPAARAETVLEMFKNGLWDREEAKLQLDDLDVEGQNRLELGPRRDLERMLDAMVTKGEYDPPEIWMPLQLARSLAQKYLGMARVDKASAKRIDLLHRFLDDIDDLVKPPPAVEVAQAAAPAPAVDPNLVQAQTALAGARAAAIGPGAPTMQMGV